MFCNKCGKEIPNDSRICKYCGAPVNQTTNTTANQASIKVKKPIYQKAWFWILIVFTIFIVIGLIGRDNTQEIETVKTTTDKQQEERTEIIVADLSTMTKEEIQKWANNKKIKIKFSEEYNSNVAKGKFISQSINFDKIIHEGDTITVVYSLGKKPSTEDINALKKAESYSSTLHMSKKAIYKQLTSEFEGFTKKSAQYAIDNIEVDWSKNALEKAKSYIESLHMSKNAVYKQLISEFEGFTEAEAQYAINHLDD